MPVSITLSVTNKCNSRCKTCNIWKLQRQNPKLIKEELTTGEWEQILQKMGRGPLWFTVTGGEPALRDDLTEVVSYIARYNRPRYINLATSGIYPTKIADTVQAALESLSRKGVVLTVNISVDEVGKRYGGLRGVPEGFEKMKETFSLLKSLQKEYAHLIVGANIVLSRYNHRRFRTIHHHISEELGPDSLVSELGAERGAFFFGEDISIPAGECGQLLDFLLRGENQRTKDARVIRWFRNSYYRLMKRQLPGKAAVECYAGYASAEISPTGELWNCSTRIDSFGNLRDYGYDFKRVWRSERANEVRAKIKEERCFCTGANPNYMNILCNISSWELW